MDDSAVQMAGWLSAHRGSWVALSAPGLIASCFLAFNALRIVLHVPQLLTCLRDDTGCSAINLWTWCSWSAASLSNALYMGVILGDAWGLSLNLANALMCAVTVCITCYKRRRLAPAADPQGQRVRSAGVVFTR
jgi:hypothetical protein